MAAPMYPAHLLAAAKDRSLVVFVGAGMSRLAGGPLWRDIVSDLVRDTDHRGPYESSVSALRALAPTVADPDASRHLVELADRLEFEGDALVAAQIAENIHGRHEVIRRISERLKRIGPPTRANALLADLPVDTWITTNYDGLLEESLRSVGRATDVVVNDIDVAYWLDAKVRVLKFHGSLSRLHFAADSVVLTEDDYERMEETRPNMLGLLGYLVRVATFLFVGYSFSDPDFVRLYRRVERSLGGHKRQAFMVQFDLAAPLAANWKRKGVNVLSLPGKDPAVELERWLEGLAALV